MKLVLAIHILDPETGARVDTFTPDKGWATAFGPWQEVPYVEQAWIPDPMRRYSEWLTQEGYKVEIEPGEEESVEGRVY